MGRVWQMSLLTCHQLGATGQLFELVSPYWLDPSNPLTHKPQTGQGELAYHSLFLTVLKMNLMLLELKLMMVNVFMNFIYFNFFIHHLIH